jgi:hypothetical protein
MTAKEFPAAKSLYQAWITEGMLDRLRKQVLLNVGKTSG